MPHTRWHDATEEAAQSYVNNESEWDVTEDIISEVGETFCSSVVYATYK